MTKSLKTLLTGATVALALLGAHATSMAAEVGKPAPEFTLTDTNGKSHSLSDFKGKYVVLEWLNHSCPFVVRHYNIKNMQAQQEAMAGKGVVWLSINSTAESNDNYLSPEAANKKNAEVGGNAAAILMDADGKVGKAYDAKTTPHMFVINPEGTLIYNGAIDDKKDGKADAPAGESYVALAIDEAMAGKPVTTATTKPYGCSVKYE